MASVERDARGMEVTCCLFEAERRVKIDGRAMECANHVTHSSLAGAGNKPQALARQGWPEAVTSRFLGDNHACQVQGRGCLRGQLTLEAHKVLLDTGAATASGLAADFVVVLRATLAQQLG